MISSKKHHFIIVIFFFAFASSCCAQKKQVKIIEAKKEVISSGIAGPGPLNSYSIKLLVLKSSIVFDSIFVSTIPVVFKIQKNGKILPQPYSSNSNDTLIIRYSLKASEASEKALVKYHYKNKKQLLVVENIKTVKKNFLP